MHPATKTIRSVLLCALLASSGCFSLSREATSARHFVLGGSGQTGGAAPTEESAGAFVGLRTPRIAEYLATPFIVVRHGPHRIAFSEFNRWGEDLARGINRAVAGHMAARAPFPRVETAPWSQETPPEYLIQLDLLRFEGVATENPEGGDGEAHVLVTWEILNQQDGALLARGTTEVRKHVWTPGDFDGLVGLLDEALVELANDLVLGLERALAR